MPSSLDVLGLVGMHVGHPFFASQEPWPSWQILSVTVSIVIYERVDNDLLIPSLMLTPAG